MSLEPTRLTLTIWRGVTFQRSISYFTDSTETSRRDLTGFTAEFNIRDKPGGTILDHYTDADTLTLRGSLGVISILIPDFVTKAYAFKNATYGLTIASPDSIVEPLLHGAIRVLDL